MTQSSSLIFKDSGELDVSDSTDFKTSVMHFLKNCQTNYQDTFNIKEISDQMGFKQRRFLDVLSVFDTIGCAPKIDSDNFLWLGLDQVRPAILQICKERGVFKRNTTLSQNIPITGFISLTEMTEDLLVCFIAMERKFLNILHVTSFLSRWNDRQKTIKCKLYQACAILEVAGIIHKTINKSEFRIDEKYFISASEKMAERDSILSISSLLNRSTPFMNENTILIRRKEFDDAILQTN